MIQWCLSNAPKGTRILSVAHAPQKDTYTVILVRLFNGEVYYTEMNSILAAMGIGQLNAVGQLFYVCSGDSASSLARELGTAVWNDENAYQSHQV